ncbi:hypothetical protein FACS1894184_03580 [Clostridia bacterium]|nr:hypothetical protein FACS1894184_03580 [Clostridia bacterium]
MKITVDQGVFHSRFDDYGRQENFTYDALDELFHYYTELEESTGEEIELDVVATCCNWSEYTADELVDDYGHIIDEQFTDDDATVENVLSYLESLTEVIIVKHDDKPDTYLVECFC